MEPDKGIYDAYNKGLKVAEGEVIGFLNSDDLYATSRVIEDVMHVFEDLSIDAVYADLVYVDKNDISKVVRHWKSRPYRQGDFKRAFAGTSNPVFAKSVYTRIGNFNAAFRFSGDYEYMLRAFHTHELNHSLFA